jgi:hypothetical protein
MTLYKCNHNQETIILDDNIISHLAYLDWAESVGINGTKELCWNCWNEKNCNIIDSQQKTFYTGEGKKDGDVQSIADSEDVGENSQFLRDNADTHNHILNWSTYCATTNQRNQCSKETCTIFPICKFKEVRE